MNTATELDAARRAIQDGDLDRAEALCRPLLEGDSAAAASSLMVAVAMRRGALEESLTWFGKARALGLADPMLFSNAGEAYRRLGRLDEAYDCFEQALRLDNNNPVPFFNMGFVMRERGDARLAEHFFRSALMSDPSMG